MFMLQAVLSTFPMFVCLFWFITIIVDKKKITRARKLLAVFMFASFLVFFSHAYYFNRGTALFHIVESLYSLCSLLVYPLFFLYIAELTGTRMTPVRQLSVVLPSCILFIIIFIVFFLMLPSEQSAYKQFVIEGRKISQLSGTASVQAVVFRLSRLVYVLQIIPIVLISKKNIERYQNELENFYSFTEDRSLWWARNMLYVMVLTSVMSAVFSLIGRAVFGTSLWILLIPSIIFTILLYMVGYVGYHQRFTAGDFENDIRETDKISVGQTGDDQNLKDRLVCLMNRDMIYTREDLHITDVASLLGSNRTYISQVVNQDFGVSFSQFINSYRITYAKKLLTDPASRHLSIKCIGEIAGFSNESSFFRVFKKETGQSPAVWRSSVKV